MPDPRWLGARAQPSAEIPIQKAFGLVSNYVLMFIPANTPAVPPQPAAAGGHADRDQPGITTGSQRLKNDFQRVQGRPSRPVPYLLPAGDARRGDDRVLRLG
jgi:hypothetical protein